MYSKALKALKAYKPKRLASGWYKSPYGGAHCAIGVAVPATAKVSYDELEMEITQLVSSVPSITAALAAAGLTLHEAQQLQAVNDHCRIGFDTPVGEADAKRYEIVVAWLEAKVAQGRARARANRIARDAGVRL